GRSLQPALYALAAEKISLEGREMSPRGGYISAQRPVNSRSRLLHSTTAPAVRRLRLRLLSDRPLNGRSYLPHPTRANARVAIIDLSAVRTRSCVLHESPRGIFSCSTG